LAQNSVDSIELDDDFDKPDQDNLKACEAVDEQEPTAPPTPDVVQPTDPLTPAVEKT
jgi:hypothetical protein